MKTYSSCTTRELGIINPGKGLPLFPSEQFRSLQVMYCDPVGEEEIKAKKYSKDRKRHSSVVYDQDFSTDYGKIKTSEASLDFH